ncbi:DUF2997 domain-containing protein [Desulfococcus sp.]|uniref:DUF2997 domain-containing protein n=1 Tax=Desulfococcus sp. TaxID=2025834 RepID=UPI0035947A8F
MEIQEVDIFITPDGQISYEVRGVKGRKCLDVTRQLEEDLGGVILSREATWEMGREEALQEIEHRVKTKD